MNHAQYCAYVADVLHPGRAEEVAEAAAADPLIWAELQSLREQMFEPPPAPAWRPPPPRHPLGLRLGAQPMGAMSGAEATRVRVSLPAEADRSALLVLLWRPERGDWQVQLPTRPTQVRRVGQLPVNADGQPFLEVIARPEAGPQRWALILAPADQPIDWSLPEDARWTALMAAVEAGAAPAASLAWPG
jgi:hypothetical protein